MRAQPAIPRPHTRNDRMFCALRTERSLLKQYVQHFRGREEPGNVFAAGGDARATLQAVDTLREWLASFGAGQLLVELATVAASTNAQDERRMAVGRYLSELASPSSVCCYMPLAAAKLVDAWLRSLVTGGTALLAVDELAMHAPAAAKFVTAWSDLRPGVPLPEAVRAVLRKLADVTLDIYHKQDATTYAWDSYLPSTAPPSSTTDECLDTGICCGLPQVRQRPLFELDAADDGCSVVDKQCRHAFTAGSRASRRTGGLFIFMCGHGIVYCFFILGGAEGRDEAFSFLYQYFKVMPRLIVYDFSCALHEFALNRCPYLFQNTTFAVDRFHWVNHVSCAASYNLNVHADWSHVNSQAVEQCNSVLQKIKSCVGQMTQRNFMFHVRLFIGVRNERRASKLQAVVQKIRDGGMI